MDVYKRSVEDVFRNPKHRPRFIVTVYDHRHTDKDAAHGVGTIDPRGRTRSHIRSVIRNVSNQPPYSICLDLKLTITRASQLDRGCA
ncbi:hypothetical protein BJV77DRAFT_969182, partial [Russula vinacea]